MKPSEREDSLATARDAPGELGERLQRMVGFRDVGVHQYRDLDLAVVQAVIATNLDDLLDLADTIRRELDSQPGAGKG